MKSKPSTLAETLDRLPNLLKELCGAAVHDIGSFTRSKVKTAISSEQGVYLFSESATGTPAYVGRSANLSQRLGTNHRSKLKNQAPVTKAIMSDRNLDSMADARKLLYENYVVRVLLVSDSWTRALLEVYAAMVLKTEFNSFLEH